MFIHKERCIQTFTHDMYVYIYIYIHIYIYIYIYIHIYTHTRMSQVKTYGPLPDEIA